MRASEWVAIAQRNMKSYRHVLCGFCGAESLAGGAVAFCSNCESLIGSNANALRGGDPALFSLLGSLRTAELKNDFETAETVYGQLLKERQSPQLLYAMGLMQIQRSNYVVSQIGYGRRGSAGRNAELREAGTLFASDGKRLIAKSRSVSEVEAREAPSVAAFYNIFLCDLKMGSKRAAGWHSKRIAELDKEGTVASYAKIVLDSDVGLYREAGEELDRLAMAGNPPANAFYYAAFIAFETGDHKGAERILSASGALIEEQKKANILEAMKGGR